METLLFISTLLSAVGSGLMAGLYFIFSNTVMTALGQQKPAEGIRAMQAINRIIQNPWFFLVFFGTGVLTLMVLVSALTGAVTEGRGYVMAGSLLYLFGHIVLTIARNVPLNNALDASDPDSPQGAEVWARYLKEWTAWNHVRMVACILAMMAFILAL